MSFIERQLPRVCWALFATACSASGDQLLGRVRADDTIALDAGTVTSDASVGDAAGCSNHPVMTEEVMPDLYFLIDRSQAMHDDQDAKWDVVSSAFTRLLRSPTLANINVGVGFFPPPNGFAECFQRCTGSCDCMSACGCPCGQRGEIRNCSRQPSACDPSTYGSFDLRPATENQAALSLALLGPGPAGPSALRPALQGSLDRASKWDSAHAGRRVVEVLVVGGPPSAETCQPNAISDCANVVAGSNTKVYVVAVDTDPNAFGPIATAAGTSPVLTFDTRKEFTPKLEEIVQKIRDSERDCELELPHGEALDYSKLNLEISVPGFDHLVAKQVKNRLACTSSGWFFDNPDHPSRIIACGGTCSALQKSAGAAAQISFGCQTVTASSPL